MPPNSDDPLGPPRENGAAPPKSDDPLEAPRENGAAPGAPAGKKEKGAAGVEADGDEEEKLNSEDPRGAPVPVGGGIAKMEGAVDGAKAVAALVGRSNLKAGVDSRVNWLPVTGGSKTELLVDGENGLEGAVPNREFPEAADELDTIDVKLKPLGGGAESPFAGGSAGSGVEAKGLSFGSSAGELGGGATGVFSSVSSSMFGLASGSGLGLGPRGD